MLIQFRVENHRSLRDEQVLSMVARPLGDKDDARLIRPEGLEHALLPAAALYGANASGKSSVIGALAFMHRAVLASQRLWAPGRGTRQEPFALSDKAREPSLYEVDFIVDKTRYRYGFVLGATQVEEEWAFAWPRARRQTWFERERDKFAFGKNLRGENQIIEGLTRPNSLFLSAAAQNNHAQLTPLYRWFSRMAIRYSGELRARPPIALRLAHAVKYGDRDAIVSLLRAADTGIIDFRIDEKSRLDDGTVDQMLYFRHKTPDKDRGWLPSHSESDGTIRLLEISSRLIRVLRTGGVFCVDELEASLHPLLAHALVKLFNDPKQNPNGSQIIFTTHDTSLLSDIVDESPLRRDQIWLTEKDDDGATRLYPLTDFKPRKQENLERGYLQGRYGATPFLDRLAAPSRPPETS